MERIEQAPQPREAGFVPAKNPARKYCQPLSTEAPVKREEASNYAGEAGAQGSSSGYYLEGLKTNPFDSRPPSSFEPFTLLRPPNSFEPSPTLGSEFFEELDREKMDPSLQPRPLTINTQPGPQRASFTSNSSNELETPITPASMSFPSRHHSHSSNAQRKASMEGKVRGYDVGSQEFRDAVTGRAVSFSSQHSGTHTERLTEPTNPPQTTSRGKLIARKNSYVLYKPDPQQPSRQKTLSSTQRGNITKVALPAPPVLVNLSSSAPPLPPNWRSVAVQGVSRENIERSPPLPPGRPSDFANEQSSTKPVYPSHYNPSAGRVHPILQEPRVSAEQVTAPMSTSLERSSTTGSRITTIRSMPHNSNIIFQPLGSKPLTLQIDGSCRSIEPGREFSHKEKSVFGFGTNAELSAKNGAIKICSGAVRLQEKKPDKAYALELVLQGFYTNKTHKYSKCRNCCFEGKAVPRAGPGVNNTMWDIDKSVYESDGILYRWEFLFRSHIKQRNPIPHPVDAQFACMFCYADGRGTPVFEGVARLLNHLQSHRTGKLDAKAVEYMKAIVGRSPDISEDFAIAIPPLYI